MLSHSSSHSSSHSHSSISLFHSSSASTVSEDASPTVTQHNDHESVASSDSMHRSIASVTPAASSASIGSTNSPFHTPTRPTNKSMVYYSPVSLVRSANANINNNINNRPTSSSVTKATPNTTPASLTRAKDMR